MQQDITIAQDFLKLLPDSDTVFCNQRRFSRKAFTPPHFD